MSKISLKLGEINRSKLAIIAIFAIVLVALPMFAFSSHRNNIYVKAGASGSQDGSVSHPYSNINEALKHANSKTDIHVADGNYKENFTIKKGVNVFGESEDGVVITAETDRYAVARMKDDTTIDKVTLRGGKWGIEVNNNAKVSIVRCKVKNNDNDGIHIEEDASSRVSITKSEIRNNGRAGIFSKKRNLSIIDNDIQDNRKDGIDVAGGSEAWIDDNDIQNNGGSGLKLAIDGSNIWTKNNNIRDNSREGMEISFGGAAGRVNVAKSGFINNGRYGIARVQDFPINANSTNLWNRDLTVDTGTQFSKNGEGNISVIIVRN